MFSFDLSMDLKVTDIDQILLDWEFKRPHAMRCGHDGALYLIEWGSGFGGDNADSGLYSIDYVSGERSPVARVSASATNGPTPLEVTFDASNSFHPDGSAYEMAWDFGDGDSGHPRSRHAHIQRCGNAHSDSDN